MFTSLSAYENTLLLRLRLKIQQTKKTTIDFVHRTFIQTKKTKIEHFISFLFFKRLSTPVFLFSSFVLFTNNTHNTSVHTYIIFCTLFES